MTVQEVIALAADNMGRKDLKELIVNSPAAAETTALVRCYNLVENEIALDYFPLRAEEDFTPEEGKIEYARFSHAPVNVTKVTRGGAPVKFGLFPAYLSVAQAGRVTVSYSYSPVPKRLLENSEFTEKISARLMSFGVACEYCLTCGKYQEAAMWEGRFRDALRAAGILRRTLAIRSRRWA